MKVVCLHEDGLAEELNLSSEWRRRYGDLTKGKEYIVLGVTFACGSTAPAGVPVFEIENDAGSLSSVPGFLVEIIDGSASRYWQFRFRGEGIVEFLPPSFYRPYYHDSLSEGIPEYVSDFREVCARLRKEEAERTRGASA